MRVEDTVDERDEFDAAHGTDDDEAFSAPAAEVVEAAGAVGAWWHRSLCSQLHLDTWQQDCSADSVAAAVAVVVDQPCVGKLQ